MTKNPVCLVIGAGGGIGANVARKFALEGYHACLCRRTDQAGLDQWVNKIKEKGADATGFLLNVVENDSIEELINSIESDIGQIEVLVYNIGAQTGLKLLEKTSHKEFELAWRMASYGLFRVAKILCPLMSSRKNGCIIVTSATAAMRGNMNQHSHASAMGARRMLCQSLNAEFGPLGLHIVHVVIDGAVDAPDTLGKMLGDDIYQQLRQSKGMENDGLMLPEKIAETYFHLAQQHRSTWTHEIDIRSFTDTAWWNSDGKFAAN